MMAPRCDEAANAGLLSLCQGVAALTLKFQQPVFSRLQAVLNNLDFTGLRTPPARPLPVVECLRMLEVDDGCLGCILSTVTTYRNDIAWGQTYDAEDFGPAFLESYGWVYLIGPSAPVHNCSVAAVLLLLGPGTTYPLHRHVGEEIYICVAGNFDIRKDDGPWCRCHPGQFSHQKPLQPHALRTGRQPALIAAYWIDADFTQKSEILERS